jgi:transcriptional regulator with XRE-family HTH domain
MLISMRESKVLDTFGKRVRALRHNMTQDELRAAMEEHGATVSQSHWSYLERGDKLPLADIVVAAAKVLGTTTDYLLLMTDNPDLPRDDAGGISEEAEAVANLVDAMTPEQRATAVAIVRALYAQTHASPATRRYDLLSAKLIESGTEEEIEETNGWLRNHIDIWRWRLRGGTFGASRK